MSSALERFYASLATLRDGLAGGRVLRDCVGVMRWPRRGVYFMFEPDEMRTDGVTPRVVRVGTHAVSKGSKTTLWKRLSDHRGNRSGAGHHRGSVFRRHVGSALMTRDHIECPTWGDQKLPKRDASPNEPEIERRVSDYIARISILWVVVDDESAKTSARVLIERGAIALLSAAPAADPPSAGWLGRHSRKTDIAATGLWNLSHVGATLDADFFEAFEHHVGLTVRDHSLPYPTR